MFLQLRINREQHPDQHRTRLCNSEHESTNFRHDLTHWVLSLRQDRNCVTESNESFNRLLIENIEKVSGLGEFSEHEGSLLARHEHLRRNDFQGGNEIFRVFVRPSPRFRHVRVTGLIHERHDGRGEGRNVYLKRINRVECSLYRCNNSVENCFSDPYKSKSTDNTHKSITETFCAVSEVIES